MWAFFITALYMDAFFSGFLSGVFLFTTAFFRHALALSAFLDRDPFYEPR